MAERLLDPPAKDFLAAVTHVVGMRTSTGCPAHSATCVGGTPPLSHVDIQAVPQLARRLGSREAAAL